MFAIAFAAVLAAGGHPSAYLFDQQAIRQHLHMCISMWSPFPTKKLGRENRSRARYTEKFKVYVTTECLEAFQRKWYNAENVKSGTIWTSVSFWLVSLSSGTVVLVIHCSNNNNNYTLSYTIIILLSDSHNYYHCQTLSDLFTVEMSSNSFRKCF